MSNVLNPRGILRTVLLTAAWCALWREISAANILAGVTVAIIVQLLAPTGSGRSLGPLGAIAQIHWLVLKDLAVSTVNVTRHILTRTNSANESIIAVQLPPVSHGHLLFLVLAVTLTPGTAVVETKPALNKVYLHLLDHRQADATRAHVLELAELACRAFPFDGSQSGGHRSGTPGAASATASANRSVN